ncbi:Uma2 family endonuclease [Actinomadura sp. NAK00032]|uniref:Uma2 family endonuclease n=1 Tax=Actinomadura sp. NAK00032 TaxID=2742128 RepID=UPI0020C7AA9E|nr:Uma2 family endonuclease [Actinomadura sp. NAK00032]
MSAQSVEAIAESGHMDAAPLPDWVIPPPGGFTADDFLRMRGLPRHTELVDGGLVFVSPQRKWHVRVINLLRDELARQAPEDLCADREMTVKLGGRQAPEPDVLIVSAEAYERDEPSTYYLPEDVLLAVEAVSPDSEIRDRETKPRRYREAGIKHYWRVEEDEGRTIVYVYELEPASDAYALTGIHHDQLKVTVPFDIEIDLTAVGKRR